MGNHINRPISTFADIDLRELAEATGNWLKVPANLAKCGMPTEIRDQLITLTAEFKKYEFIQHDPGARTVVTTVIKNEKRKKLLKWFSDNFYRFIYGNPNLNNADIIACGYRVRSTYRKRVPKPKGVLCLISVRIAHDGHIYVTAASDNEGIGKPPDVDGVELEYYEEDPRRNPLAKSTPLGQYTNVKEEIEIRFPEEFFGKTIYIRGRWYNKSGKSEWSPTIKVLLLGGQ